MRVTEISLLRCHYGQLWDLCVLQVYLALDELCDGGGGAGKVYVVVDDVAAGREALGAAVEQQAEETARVAAAAETGASIAPAFTAFTFAGLQSSTPASIYPSRSRHWDSPS